MKVHQARSYLSVLLILFSALFLASPVFGVTENVLPIIVAEFGETVVLTSISLTHATSGTLYDVLTSTADNKTFQFTPAKALQNGPYTFAVTVTDLLGNPDTFTYVFNVFVPETTITLMKPRIGVSNSTTFDLVVQTGKASDCKYRSTLVTDFDQPGLQLFEPDSSNLLHTSYNVSLQEGFPRDLFIVCLDDIGRENFAQFRLYVDLTPPTLSGVNWNPDPIVEYPMYGDIISDMSPQGSEPIICKQTNDSTAEYDVMTSFDTFNLYDFGAYLENPSQPLIFPDEPLKKTYDFYVICEDRAGWKTPNTKASVLLDLTAALNLRVNTPAPASRETEVFINITTNKLGYCQFKFAETEYAPMSSSAINISRIHTVPIGTMGSGRYTISFYCFSDISGAPEELFKDYTFIIDLDAPSQPTINVTTPICGDAAKAVFSATDALSGIKEYFWTFFSASTIFNNGTSQGDASVSQDSEGSSIVFNESDSYYFMVYAVDNAGNIGSQAQSTVMTYDATGKSCDTTPPVVTLIKNAEGTAVDMTCQDDMTGCMTYSWAYANEASCNTSAFNYVFPPISIPLFMSTYICYEVADGAGNIAKGSQLFELNLSGLEDGKLTCDEGIDNDGDGYGWGCTNGYDCDDTNSSIFLGCASGCKQDTDGDKYGWKCTNGNDCNDMNPNETTICANGCISDNDGDGRGLGCDDGADCNGLDPGISITCPNGCYDDNDGDGYGFGCAAGLDCNGEDSDKRTLCANNCVSDMDGDTFGYGCDNGPDCDGLNPNLATGCDNNCVIDEDSDGYGIGCDDGLDCDGVNPLQAEDCPNGCVQDADGDQRGYMCVAGYDCHDMDPKMTTSCDSGCIQDIDADSHGLCCIAGADCDDFDFTVTTDCGSNCSFDVDCDRMDDAWEERYNLSLAIDDSQDDPDDDDFTNLEEFCSNQDPTVKNEEFRKADPQKDVPDADGDGVLDSCERRYPLALSPEDPFDANLDYDGDTLSNSFECGYTEGSCFSGLNPQEADTDIDGFNDGLEIDAGTDPCDPDSKPGSPLGLMLLILGVIQEIGAINWWIYKKRYLPLTKPKPKLVSKQPVQQRQQVRMSQAARPVVPRRHHPIAHHRRMGKGFTEKLSREKYLEEQRKKMLERHKMFDVFGARTEKQMTAEKTMRGIAKKNAAEAKAVAAAKRREAARPATKKKEAVKEPEKKVTKKTGEDHVDKLSRLVESDAVDKLSRLSSSQIDEFEKLAKIVKQKTEKRLEDDEVDKLTKITKKIGDDKDKMKEFQKAVKKSDVDRLDELPTTKKDIDKFIESQGQKKSDVLDDIELLSAGKEEKDVFDSLEHISKKKDLGASTAEKIAELKDIGSRAELEKVLKSISKDTNVDKNVFQVLLTYLLQSKKITKKDVSQILLDLEKQDVLSRKDVADVFFHMGINR